MLQSHLGEAHRTNKFNTAPLTSLGTLASMKGCSHCATATLGVNQSTHITLCINAMFLSSSPCGSCVRCSISSEEPILLPIAMIPTIEQPLTPTLIGYFPKRTVKRPDWLHAEGIDEVCSVSTCISEAPHDWINLWRHNEMFVFDSPELAWGIVPEAARGEYDLYAYHLYPVVFTGGERRDFAIPKVQPRPMSSSFVRLGCDAVSRSCGSTFECSPLSCNHMAARWPVNRQCLVEEIDTALRMAAEFEAGGAEPGPYFVVEVWRDRDRGTHRLLSKAHPETP